MKVPHSQLYSFSFKFLLFQNQPTPFSQPFNFGNSGGGMFNQPQFPGGEQQQQQSTMFTIGSTNQGRRKLKPKKK